MNCISKGRKPESWRAAACIAFVALSLGACKPAAEPASTAASQDEPTPVEQAVANASASAAPAAPTPPGEWSGTVPDPKASAAAVAADDLFIGWYYEQGGQGRLLACGQSVSLQVSDPTFLRGLKAKMGGGSQPVFVRLKVRPAAQSQLEVSDVQQFGVDEGPVPDCELVAQRR